MNRYGVETKLCRLAWHRARIARPSVDRRFVLALRRLARSRQALSSAEAWRLLAYVAAKIDVPRPSYSTVRDIWFHEQLVARERIEDLDAMIRDFSRGYFHLPSSLRF